MSLTTDPKSPCLNEPKGEGQENKCYLILSEEERAKGFVRPVRRTYVHVGRKLHYKGIWRMLDEEEKKEYPDKNYVAVMTVILKEDGSPLGGAYVTQEEFDAWKSGKRIGGCGCETTMAREIAETYARNPNFYGATWCCRCHKHLPVGEFFWDGTEEEVGS